MKIIELWQSWEKKIEEKINFCVGLKLKSTKFYQAKFVDLTVKVPEKIKRICKIFPTLK